MYYASMAIAIAGLVVYQLIMKSVPSGVNPWWLLCMAYGMAAVACAPAAVVWKWFVAPGETPPGLSHLTIAGLIALAVILIEIGYLLVYRSGWLISVAPGVAQAFTLSLLFLVGLVFFAEQLTLAKSAGLVLSLAGIFLLTYKAPPALPEAQASAPIGQTTGQ
jgi:multidrug transporter EmrE-like cation transporter